MRKLDAHKCLNMAPARVDESQLGETIEAFAELRFTGSTKVEEITASAKQIPEVIAIYTVAGDPAATQHPTTSMRPDPQEAAL